MDKRSILDPTVLSWAGKNRFSGRVSTVRSTVIQTPIPERSSPVVQSNYGPLCTRRRDLVFWGVPVFCRRTANYQYGHGRHPQYLFRATAKQHASNAAPAMGADDYEVGSPE